MRVVVTRAEAQADPLAERLAALGHEVVGCPLIGIEPLGDDPVDPAPYDWVVVTSPNGAAELARRLAAPPRRLAAIGPGHGGRAAGARLGPTRYPRSRPRRGCAASCPGRPAACCSPRPKVRDGCSWTSWMRTSCRSIALSSLVPAAPPGGDVVVLASGSAARALARTGARLPVVAIGPQTAEAAREAGLDVVAEAQTHDLDGLLAAVAALA